MRFQRLAELSKRQVEMAKVIWEAVPSFHRAQVYGFKVKICFLAIAGQHLSIIRQVHGLCLGLTGPLREKIRHPLPFTHYAFPDGH